MKKKENPDNMLDKIVLVATLYYKNKLSQQEIAKKLSISRPWVSKLLSRAEDLGIVKIEINSPVTGNSQLEEALKEKYGLSYAGVISTKDQNRDYVAQAAADYFISQLKPKDIVGVGWGKPCPVLLKNCIPSAFRMYRLSLWPEASVNPSRRFPPITLSSWQIPSAEPQKCFTFLPFVLPKKNMKP